MYLIHWPLPFAYVGDDIQKDENCFPKDENGKIRIASVPLRETWEEMEKLVQDGLVKVSEWMCLISQRWMFVNVCVSFFPHIASFCSHFI